jgi:hypothetical protein
MTMLPFIEAQPTGFPHVKPAQNHHIETISSVDPVNGYANLLPTHFGLSPIRNANSLGKRGLSTEISRETVEDGFGTSTG